MDKDYEILMGNWVTARCKKRVEETGEQMPEEVRIWLDTGGNSRADGNTQAQSCVLGWLVKTLVKPDWVEP